MGEHTNHNDGLVTPAAIELYTWVAAAKRAERVLEVYSDSFDEKVSLSLDDSMSWRGGLEDTRAICPRGACG